VPESIQTQQWLFHKQMLDEHHYLVKRSTADFSDVVLKAQSPLTPAFGVGGALVL
jgi:hypothetical protein